MTLGQSIQKAREDRGYSRKALSVASGVSVSVIGGWERDEVIPTAILLCCVADALEMPMDSLINRTKDYYDGQWLIDFDGVPYCSRCRARALYRNEGTHASPKFRRITTPRCPHCGAKLKGDNL
jgi:transcriptional regulator with XRE-family HTH domain